MHEIPFNRPAMVGDELRNIQATIESGNLGGNGDFSRCCVELLGERVPSGEILLTSTCTAALEIAGMIAGIGAGDEVIVPSFAYVSTANAFARLGAAPVFVDIEEESLNVDPGLLEAAVSPASKALVVIHYGGIPGPVTVYREFADRHNLVLIEDAAAALGSSHDGRPAGTFGDLAAFSFHETKNISCGQGGALVVNRPEWVEAAYIARDRGTNRQAFEKALSPSYTWQSLGSAYGMSELNAAYLCAQLAAFDRIAERRKDIFEQYEEGFSTLSEDGVVSTISPCHASHGNNHQFTLLLDSKEKREALRRHLSDGGIHATFHYQPLHQSDFGRKMGKCAGPMDVTESIADRLLRLPLFFDLTPEMVEKIVDRTEEFFATVSGGWEGYHE